MQCKRMIIDPYHTEMGELFAWGSGNEGRLGHGNNQSSNVPLVVPTLQGKIVTEIACGFQHSMALVRTAQGSELYSWGYGEQGR